MVKKIQKEGMSLYRTTMFTLKRTIRKCLIKACRYSISSELKLNDTLIVLHFIALRKYCALFGFGFVNKLKVCGSPVSSKSIRVTAFAYFVSVTSWLILTTFHFFLLSLYLLQWSVWLMIFDIIVLGCHEMHLCAMTKLIDKCACSACSTACSVIPHLSPQASLWPKTQQYWN